MYGMLKQQWVEGSYMPSRGHALHVYIRQRKMRENKSDGWLHGKLVTRKYDAHSLFISLSDMPILYGLIHVYMHVRITLFRYGNIWLWKSCFSCVFNRVLQNDKLQKVHQASKNGGTVLPRIQR